MTPAVDALAGVVREAHSKAMEALGADVHPYSSTAIRDWEEALDAALSDLAACARERDEREAGAQWQYEMGKGWRDRALAAEADRDRLARRVAELEAENADLLTGTRMPDSAAARMSWLVMRVAELEAALREAKWLIGAGYPHTVEWHERADAWYTEARRLAGDGGGA